jgi:glycosyltransferase involved in cell wall biosynthesis
MQIAEIQKSDLRNLDSIESLLLRLFDVIPTTQNRIMSDVDLCIDVTTTNKQPFETGIQLVVRGLSKEGSREVQKIIFNGGSGYKIVKNDLISSISAKARFYRMGAWIWHRILLPGLEIPFLKRLAKFTIPLMRSFSNKINNFGRDGKYVDGIYLPLGKRLILAEVPNDPKHIAFLNILATFNLVKLEVLLHDLIPLTHPELCSKDPEENFLSYLLVVSKASRVVCISKHVLESYLNYRKSLNYENSTQIIEAHPYKTSPLFINRSRQNSDSNQIDEVKKILLDKKYFIFPGGFSPRKNLLLILSAMELIEVEDDYRLVVTGHKIWGDHNFNRRLKSLNYSKEKVLFMPDVSRDKMLWLMENSIAVLYPSLIEGFGLPILEAEFLRVPVLCLNEPPMNEISEAAIVLENSAIRWAAEMKILLSNGQRHRPPTFDFDHESAWENWAEHLLQ